MDYEDDDFYCDSEEEGYAESDDETEDKLREEKDFKILSGETIRLLQEKDILETSSLLGLSIEETTILLLTHNWKKIDLHDEWFADEEKVRKRAGLLVNPVVDISGFSKDQFYCKICMDELPLNKSRSVACGHPFCDECWGNYIRVSIDDGPDCLLLKCPEPPCGAAVGKDMVVTLLSDEEKGKYLYYLFRSYIEQNRKIKWCPAPNCDCAIEFEIGSEKFEVTCDCSYRFCWNCTEEIHSPVDCETVIKWIMKNGAESENMNWILANSKPCPKCKRPIEKNQGCMHMTCRICKHEFCWLCLGNWTSHGNKTGGFYSCNIYTGQQQEGKIDEAERTREYAKQALDRYLHYYERWDSNQKAIIKAKEELKKVRELKLDELSREHDEYQSQLRLIEAWEQIIECRRVLKWSYAYGYYLPQEDIIKKQFFECSQGEAEAALERLHHCTEKESFYLEDDEPEKCSNKMSYKDYHMKLVNLTVSAKNHFENGLKKLVAMDLL